MRMPEMIDNEEYLNTDEAAKFTGYSRNWFEKRIVPEHHIKVYKRGVRRGKLFKKSDLEPLVKIQPVEPEEDHQ